MRNRILAFCTACIICVSFCLYSVAPVRVSASGGGVTALYDLYQLYLLLMGISTSSSNSDYGFDDYWHDNFEHKNYYEEWDSDLTDYEAGWYTIFDAIHLDDLVTNIDKLVASWDETYDTVGGVGSYVVSSCPGLISDDRSVYMISGSDNLDYHILTEFYFPLPDGGYDSTLCNTSVIVKNPSSHGDYYLVLKDGIVYGISRSDNLSRYLLQFDGLYLGAFDYGNGFDFFYANGYKYYYYGTSNMLYCPVNPSINARLYYLQKTGIDLVDIGGKSLSDLFADIDNLNFNPLSDDFIGPVYSYPAAEQLAKDNNTSSGIRLAVDTDTGVADLNAVLDRTGCDDMDDVVAGVAAGTIPMSDVFDAAGVTPYILTDVNTGEVITDMDVSASAEGVKPVALTSELAVPADLAAAEALSIPGRTYDPDTSKYKLPLFNFFPFCLPWDIYKVLSSFDADPVAPVFDIPLGKFFARAQGGDATASYVATVDLGEEHYAKWFTLLRSLECIGIIVGFVLLARALIHGGD